MDAVADALVLYGTVGAVAGAVLRYTYAAPWWPLDVGEAFVEGLGLVLIVGGAIAIALGLVAQVVT